MISRAALTVLDAAPDAQIRAAASAGFQGIGLRLNPLLPSDPVVVGNLAQEKAVETALNETGLAVIEIGVFPVKPDLDVEALAPVLSFSHKIGAQFLTCPVEDASKQRRLQTLARLCELAESCALDVLVEFNPYSACASLSEAAELVSACGRPNARLLIDALHLSRSGGKPADLLTIDPELIALVHLCDAPPPPDLSRSADELRRESRTARLYPGEGALWLGELLDYLPVGTPLSVEAPSAAHAHLTAQERATAAFAATRRFLQRHGRKIT